ncbi:MAG: hypothetical protein CGU28_15895 [Candidatus Dactylopiibacterium carminicum]|uniref:Lipoprotein n=1 Tax=Candidatus Dactylopiibacterium carminicum TaxID=857335 RepID=A0A272EN13_9RHOO|nr:hypothetical protein [Candidatus Dactylopiibacterium carminicum]KAF7597908.1 hypothetical protein BGI27_16165 [Candidatus Dactylopiibacterium carminicum]PAS91482.1 MAG: hypothetical protein CGU29_16200 [Candidatus Dactylopiibacterium carminicum]PAS92967.1 MAG: hypothetical protein CGU28_15895 [Candidatus Dactylopiibacterium carminicum]PAS95929.1 MAG: hypothetical protein BSR46_16200 [Candidatus Dactylopiibacterium carminicum]
MKIRMLVLSVMALVGLSACENDAASMLIDGKEHSISLMREQSWVWSSQVEQRFIVSRLPECQRRYTVDPGARTMAPIELYEIRAMLYVAKQGDTWYAVGTEACQVQKFQEKPERIPGRLLGRFEQGEAGLVFTPEKVAP